MAYRGTNHGGNGKTAAEVKAMQDKYVEGVSNGLTKTKAAELAGYSDPNGNIAHIESAPIHARILAALEAKGWTPEKIIDEYTEINRLAKKTGAKDLDLKSAVKSLQNMTWMWTSRERAILARQPAVAVQINNGSVAGAAGSDGLGSTQDALREVRELLELVRETVGRRDTSGVHGAQLGTPVAPSDPVVDVPSHPGVVSSSADGTETTDRGGA